MKIIAFLNSYTEGLSGGDLRFIEIMKRLTQNEDVKLTIVTSKLGKSLCKLRGLNQSFVETTQENTTGNILSLYARRIFSSLSIKLDFYGSVFYSTSDFLPDVLPAYRAKSGSDIKWVQVIHHLYDKPFSRLGENFFINFLGFFSQRFSLILIKRRADLVIVVNPITKLQLMRIGFRENKISVNYNGVDAKKFHCFETSIKKYAAVFLGRLSVSKGIFDLIDVWKRVTKEKPGEVLAIIGRGNDHVEKRLRDLIKNNNLENNINILGPLQDPDTISIMNSSKLFLFPSHEEGFGIAVLEAMACGLPVVAWNLSVYKNVFCQGMITIPVGDFERMANAVLELLNNPELRSNISKYSQILASKYDWNDIARKEKLLIEVLQK